MRHKFDALILGSGAAGLTLGLNLAKTMKIAVLSKNSLEEGSTYYAQGGISAVLSTSDSNESHINDTLIAGADLCDEKAVEFTVKNGAAAIDWLQQINVPFTKSDKTESGLHLTREGGHSHRRIVHADDATGSAVEKSLLEQTLEHPNIEMFAEHVAINLITTKHHGQATCVGAYVYDKQENKVDVFQAKFIILATGGASKTYLYTSNPDGATGDGIAMAWRAGCRIANMEFMQFHPTCLYHPQAKNFLISEAVRGEGGHLILANGERFMTRFDERMELAPRDIVARAIDHEIKRLGCDSVYLDISHKPADSIKKHFPTIYEKCLSYGYDMTKEPLPVVPAAHYTCGGVITDLKARTDIVNLYAVGEVSCTGLHGANRLASNSILECLVFGKAAADDIMSKHSMPMIDTTIDAWDESRVTNSDEQVVVTHNWNELRRFMWDYVGIVRSTKRLQRAKHRVDLLNKEIDEYYSNFKVNADLIELRNLAQVADLIIRSAMLRKESRGLHYTLDYPEKDPALDNIPSILKPGADKSITPLHIV